MDFVVQRVPQDLQETLFRMVSRDAGDRKDHLAVLEHAVGFSATTLPASVESALG